MSYQSDLNMKKNKFTDIEQKLSGLHKFKFISFNEYFFNYDETNTNRKALDQNNKNNLLTSIKNATNDTSNAVAFIPVLHYASQNFTKIEAAKALLRFVDNCQHNIDILSSLNWISRLYYKFKSKIYDSSTKDEQCNKNLILEKLGIQKGDINYQKLYSQINRGCAINIFELKCDSDVLEIITEVCKKFTGANNANIDIYSNTMYAVYHGNCIYDYTKVGYYNEVNEEMKKGALYKDGDGYINNSYDIANVNDVSKVLFLRSRLGHIICRDLMFGIHSIIKQNNVYALQVIQSRNINALELLFIRHVIRNVPIFHVDSRYSNSYVQHVHDNIYKVLPHSDTILAAKCFALLGKNNEIKSFHNGAIQYYYILFVFNDRDCFCKLFIEVI